jgi:hypothetical protein
MSNELRSVQLPSSLCEAAECRFSPEFNGVEELLTHVLKELLREDATQFDNREKEMIDARLKDLGYL